MTSYKAEREDGCTVVGLWDREGSRIRLLKE